MSAQRIFSTTGQVALQILQLAVDVFDAFPLLKGAAADALSIVQLAESFRLNQMKWQNFAVYVRDATASVVQTLVNVTEIPEVTIKHLNKLKAALEMATNRIKFEQALSRPKRLINFIHDSDTISDLKQQLDDAVNLFRLSTSITTMVDVHKTFSAIILQDQRLFRIAQDTSAVMAKTESISGKASFLDMNTTLDKLRRVQGASWDTARVCLDHTRVGLVNTIIAWASDEKMPNKPVEVEGAKVMLLTAVAGAGKTAVAHTVAQRCAKKKQLVSSFFFDRRVQDRNSPVALFTTMAADLSRCDSRIAERIAAQLREDPSLLCAPISRQFEQLVQGPCYGFSIPGSKVFVVDALDEAWDHDLANILLYRLGKLPGTFRFLLTSRMRPELDTLRLAPHVRTIELDITAQDNKEDIAMFVSHELGLLARDRNLGDNWPGELLCTQLVARAGGLFQWVTIVCEYLRHRNDPTEELRQLMSDNDSSTTTVETRIDTLYTTILESFDWTDKSFVDGYRKVMGMALANKASLTISAMKKLYHGQNLTSDYTLQSLSPLLTGMNKAEHDSRVVQILHPSLRDFLVVRSINSPHTNKFGIKENEYSQELALLCLDILNRELNADLYGAGYLSQQHREPSRLPIVEKETISEALWYACRFWPDHVADVELADSVQQKLVMFVREKLVLWLEIVAVRGWLCPLGKVRNWIQSKLEEEDIQELQVPCQQYGSACLFLSDCLAFEDRTEDSLKMIEEGLLWSSKRVRQYMVPFSTRNAESIFIGYGDEIPSASELHQQLSSSRPTAYTPHVLAESLKRFSLHLSYLDQYVDALLVIEDALRLYRTLAGEQPATYTADVVQCLTIHYRCRSRIDNPLTAIASLKEATEICQQLDEEQIIAYQPSLVSALIDLSNGLFDRSRQEEAMEVLQMAASCRSLSKTILARVSERLSAFGEPSTTQGDDLESHVISF